MTVPHKMVELERMSEYRGDHYITILKKLFMHNSLAYTYILGTFGDRVTSQWKTR